MEKERRGAFPPKVEAEPTQAIAVVGRDWKVVITNLLKVLRDREYIDMFLAKFEAIIHRDKYGRKLVG